MAEMFVVVLCLVAIVSIVVATVEGASGNSKRALAVAVAGLVSAGTLYAVTYREAVPLRVRTYPLVDIRRGEAPFERVVVISAPEGPRTVRGHLTEKIGDETSSTLSVQVTTWGKRFPAWMPAWARLTLPPDMQGGGPDTTIAVLGPPTLLKELNE